MPIGDSNAAQLDLNTTRFTVGSGLSSVIDTTAAVQFVFYMQSLDGNHNELYKVQADFSAGGNYDDTSENNFFDFQMPTGIDVGESYVANLTCFTKGTAPLQKEVIEVELKKKGGPDLTAVTTNNVSGLINGTRITLPSSVTAGTTDNPTMTSLTAIINIIDQPQLIIKTIDDTEYNSLKTAGDGVVVVDVEFVDGAFPIDHQGNYSITLYGENDMGESERRISNLVFSDVPEAATNVIFYTTGITGTSHSARLEYTAKGQTNQTQTEIADTIVQLYSSDGTTLLGTKVFAATAAQKAAGTHGFVHDFTDVTSDFGLGAGNDLAANQTFPIKIKRRARPTDSDTGDTNHNYIPRYLSTAESDVNNVAGILDVITDSNFGDTYEATLTQSNVLDMLEHARTNSTEVKQIIASDIFKAAGNSAFDIAGSFSFVDNRPVFGGGTVGQLKRSLTELYDSNNNNDIVFDVEYDSTNTKYKITNSLLILPTEAELNSIYGKTVTLNDASTSGNRITIAEGTVGSDTDLDFLNIIIDSSLLTHETAYYAGLQLKYKIETVAAGVTTDGAAVQFESKTVDSKYKSASTDTPIHRFLQGATTNIFNTNSGKTALLNQLNYTTDLTKAAPYFTTTTPKHKVRLQATHTNPMNCDITFTAYRYISSSSTWDQPFVLGVISDVANGVTGVLTDHETDLQIREEYAIISKISSTANSSITEIESSQTENIEDFGTWTTSGTSGEPAVLSQINMDKFKCLVSVGPSSSATLTLGAQQSNGKYTPTVTFPHSAQAAFFRYWNDNQLKLKAKLTLKNGSDDSAIEPLVGEAAIEIDVDAGADSPTPTSNTSNLTLNGDGKHSYVFSEVSRDADGFIVAVKYYIERLSTNSSIFGSDVEIPLSSDQNESVVVTPVDAPTVSAMAIGTDTESGSTKYNVELTGLKANGQVITSVALIAYGEDLSKSAANNNTLEILGPIYMADLTASDIIGDDENSTIFNNFTSNVNFDGDVKIRISPANFAPGSNIEVDGALGVISNGRYQVFASSESSSSVDFSNFA